MPLKVIGAGQARTGTRSLKKALEILGFGPCYHMDEMLQKGSAPFWLNILANRDNLDKAALYKFFEDYNSGCDHPVEIFYQELADMYPDAKIILTTRDAEAWYRSCMESIYTLSYDWGLRVVAAVFPGVNSFRKVAADYFENEPYHGEFLNKEATIARFHACNQKVLDTIPKDRVLVFNAKDGWEPLCAFLGVPVPPTPYPHENHTARFQNVTKMFRIVATGMIVTVAAIGVGAWYRFM